jgi:ABC-type dipeptide/oligopeptide/nickel transport system permease component
LPVQPGYVPLTRNPGAWFGRMILPWIAIAATQVGVTARLTRDADLGVLGEDYIRTAYAKGLPRRRVVWLHILRSSLVSVLPSIGIGLGTLLGRRPSSTRRSRSASDHIPARVAEASGPKLTVSRLV